MGGKKWPTDFDLFKCSDAFARRSQSKASFTFTEGPAWNSVQLKDSQVSSPGKNKLPLMPDLAEETKSQPLERQVRPCWSHSGRFLTLHKRRKKRPPTRAMTSDQALLDDLYHGPTHILLARISEWPFNAFALDRATGGRPLPTLCFHLFHQYGLMAHFHLDPVKVWKFFSLVEEGYHSNNPYHNAIHAADVTQAMHCFLQEEKMRCHLTPLEIAASLIAAMAHDLDHPGVNQPFLVATSNHLASLYKNASVLENHHWRSAMACLMESGMMDSLERTSAHELQRQIQSLILATDIARQQEFLSAFQGFLNTSSLDMQTGDHRHFMLQIALKCADICNPCRPWEVSRAWSLQVSEEFYRQGDLERRLGLPVTPLCDRFTSSVCKIQTGFFRFIAAPLFEEWHRFQATPLSWNMLNYLRSNKLKWDSILNDEESGDVNLAEYQLRDPAWSELGVLEMGIEKIHLRRASLPPGRSGLWTSNSANSSRVSQVERSMEEDSSGASMDPSKCVTGEPHPPRSLLPADSHDDSSLAEPTPGDSQHTADTPGLAFGLPARLPHRRESLPFNFPDRSRMELIQRQGRRESLPTDCSRTLNACDVLPELNITSMTPLPLKKDKRISQPTNCVQPTTSTPSTSSDRSFGCADEKENIVSTAYLKTETSRLTLRRGSAPTALHPLNWLDIPRSKRNGPATQFGRQGSLRLAKCLDQNEPGFRRRGSLPYELGRKLSGHESTVARLVPGSSDCAEFDIGVRRSSAPSDLLRNTGASIASCWIQFRDRVKMKGKEVVVSAGTGLMSDNGCGFAVRECRRRSLRRRRSGGPELFASVVRRGNNFTSAHLPPLPQSATCTHAKLKRTSSLSPPECSKPLVGSGDCNRDWLLLGRRGSGALELLAGLWRQNRDRSERSSFESDDSLLKPHRQRLSMDSSSSSDGIPCSALEEYCHLIGHGRTQRRGSCPADHSVLSGSSSGNFTQLNSR
ncbi:uncharacterized protein LOC124343496 isoform X3 [Daphnia pulicaria]|uniref:uncharacterized protein LOC124343496 isoform X3 n=1 Tax=Daphnia pulicaria TaxID=35523 RepID=UPI001EEB1188|nr:uncharacterized protein LOC124343496 isoform X3 [Daphnia pulicaria]